MTSEELKTLIANGEADRVEITRAAQDNEKIRGKQSARFPMIWRGGGSRDIS